MTERIAIGPFSQVVSMEHTPVRGPLNDNQLDISTDAAIIIDQGSIAGIKPFDEVRREEKGLKLYFLEQPFVALPGFIDCHTHLCWAGSRANDYAMRLAGRTYLDIARGGGGIWSTVLHSRAAQDHELIGLMQQRLTNLLRCGVTTVEIKSGYGLGLEEELRHLRLIKKVASLSQQSIVPTCLAAHMLPRDFDGNASAYLSYLSNELLPEIIEQDLTNRIDIFVEDSAFSPEEATNYLKNAGQLGFQLTVHADQFSTGGSVVAVQAGAMSADHLEASKDHEIQLLAGSRTVAVCLPGASIGLGQGFSPARKLLDAGSILAIASDWNPGSAPMGRLLPLASILGAYEKLTIAETLAAITFRAAAALGIGNVGRLTIGSRANILAFPTENYQEIIYHQGSMNPTFVWTNGQLAFPSGDS